MGFHGQSKGVNIHVPHRWEVINESERLNIITNPDNTPLTEDNGLNCLCLQTDTGSYWRLSSVDPIEWGGVSSGAGGGGDSSSRSKNVLFSVHTPLDIDYPLSIPFRDIYMNRLSPNIVDNFDNYVNCLWDIQETEGTGIVVNTWNENKFSSYNELVSFLNDNISNGDDVVAYDLTITCYTNELTNIDPMAKIYGVNKFFSVLKSHDNYKSSNYNTKTINSENNWEDISQFMNDVYAHFLGGSYTAPPFSDMVKTFWFPQSIKRMYDQHSNNILFPNGSSGNRGYYSYSDGSVIDGISTGSWSFQSDVFFAMSGYDSTYNKLDAPTDYEMISGRSIIRVCRYHDGNNNNSMFFIKPIGMDTFYLGFHPELMKENYKLYISYNTPDRRDRIRFVKDVAFGDSSMQYGMNTSVRVDPIDYTNFITNRTLRNHMDSKSIKGKVSFLLISEDGTSVKKSRPVYIYTDNKIVKNYVLLK